MGLGPEPEMPSVAAEDLGSHDVEPVRSRLATGFNLACDSTYTVLSIVPCVEYTKTQDLHTGSERP